MCAILPKTILPVLSTLDNNLEKNRSRKITIYNMPYFLPIVRYSYLETRF